MVVLDEDGKPCRTCNSLTDFQQALFGKTDSSIPHSQPIRTDMPSPMPNAPAHFQKDPPDGFELGQSTWTFLHSLAAYYPVKPTQVQKDEMQQFLTTFSHFYPCKPCARDFGDYLKTNKPDVENRTAFSLWMCDAHNAVNTKLGKPTFDCKYWQARWREGWDDFVKSQKN